MINRNDPSLNDEVNSQNSSQADMITQEIEESNVNYSPSSPSLIWKLYERLYPDYTNGTYTTKSIPCLGLQRSSRRIVDNQVSTK